MVRLLLDHGADANLPAVDGEPPLVALLRLLRGDFRGRLAVLLQEPRLDLSRCFAGKSITEWALQKGPPDLASAIQDEVHRASLCRPNRLVVMSSPVGHGRSVDSHSRCGCV